jgi:hypothetical protein
MGDASETAGPATSQIHAQMLRYHRQSRIADAELRPTILTGNYLGAAPAAVSLVRPSSRHRTRCSALTHRGIPAIRKERVIGNWSRCLQPETSHSVITAPGFVCQPALGRVRHRSGRHDAVAKAFSASGGIRGETVRKLHREQVRVPASSWTTWIRRLRAALNGWRWCARYPPESNRCRTGAAPRHGTRRMRVPSSPPHRSPPRSRLGVAQRRKRRPVLRHDPPACRGGRGCGDVMGGQALEVETKLGR